MTRFSKALLGLGVGLMWSDSSVGLQVFSMCPLVDNSYSVQNTLALQEDWGAGLCE